MQLIFSGACLSPYPVRADAEGFSSLGLVQKLIPMITFVPRYLAMGLLELKMVSVFPLDY